MGQGVRIQPGAARKARKPWGQKETLPPNGMESGPIVLDESSCRCHSRMGRRIIVALTGCRWRPVCRVPCPPRVPSARMGDAAWHLGLFESSLGKSGFSAAC